MENRALIKRKLEYGEDWVGFLSYCINKKETMQYINDLEELVEDLNRQLINSKDEIGLLKIKLKDKNKIIKELKR